MIFISYYEEAASDVHRLTDALQTEGLAGVSNSADADTILIYITFAYIAPGSSTIDRADEFLLQRERKLVIPVFAGLSASEIKHQDGTEKVFCGTSQISWVST
ncbi:hypothetical protein KP509_32G004000 [Ceratopteris richardii]|uniref:TIR domain-containing protein n=1 Tax=Ceratopteris richardii TaxID=49495 RepID=A0A8T2QQW6_CERRI|nr:hypothetical protein KP509_32G004000 [Ceratopteris richardii]